MTFLGQPMSSEAQMIRSDGRWYSKDSIEALAKVTGLTEETPLSIPSDSKAQYFVLEKSGSGAERTIVTKRVSSSGTGYSKRLYNCADKTVKYLGTGDSLAAMDASNADPNMAPIVADSIAYYVSVEACK